MRDRSVSASRWLLCGARELIKAGYETLVMPATRPRWPISECLHEVKLIVDLIFEGGIATIELFDLQHRRVRRIWSPAHASSIARPRRR